MGFYPKRLLIVAVLLACISADASEPCYVVTDYECLTRPLYGTQELEELVKGYLSLMEYVVRPDRIFITDLNRDGLPEYFVPMSCGATGNCTYFIFADHPARSIGEVNGKHLIFSPSGTWPPIKTLAVSGMMVAIITTYTYVGDQYRPVAEEPVRLHDPIDPSQPQVITEYWEKLGGIRCECQQGRGLPGSP